MSLLTRGVDPGIPSVSMCETIQWLPLATLA